MQHGRRATLFFSVGKLINLSSSVKHQRFQHFYSTRRYDKNRFDTGHPRLAIELVATRAILIITGHRLSKEHSHIPDSARSLDDKRKSRRINSTKCEICIFVVLGEEPYRYNIVEKFSTSNDVAPSFRK